jgi:hypothetical protein
MVKYTCISMLWFDSFINPLMPNQRNTGHVMPIFAQWASLLWKGMLLYKNTGKRMVFSPWVWIWALGGWPDIIPACIIAAEEVEYVLLCIY